ncbi:hypothetical protein BV898_15023 [Hypsibius exemplaris]|uniref:Uncharacterized protein n=1 Tax=Hypsibius exemplaris TaxID=2072580 RepID=A0A9X6RK14_HYPEX|nr:hypothetical protein BV898_15023 [Hypsibius exemplaris]
MNSSISNTTRIAVQNPLSCFSVTAYKIITGITTSLSLIGDCIFLAILVTFLRRPSLITHFTIHITTFCVINLLNGLAYWPLAIARPIATSEWLNSPFPCAVFQYMIWVLPIMTLLRFN